MNNGVCHLELLTQLYKIFCKTLSKVYDKKVSKNGSTAAIVIFRANPV